MTPDVSPNVSSDLRETLQDLEKLTYKERTTRFKNLEKGEQRLLAEVIDTLFTSSLAPVKDEEKLGAIVDKLTGRVSNGKPIKEKPSSRWAAISQRVEKFVAPFFEKKIAPLFAPLGRAFVFLGEKLGMMNEAILDKKLQDASERRTLFARKQCAVLNEKYFSLKREYDGLCKEFLELKRQLEAGEGNSDELEAGEDNSDDLQRNIAEKKGQMREIEAPLRETVEALVAVTEGLPEVKKFKSDMKSHLAKELESHFIDNKEAMKTAISKEWVAEGLDLKEQFIADANRIEFLSFVDKKTDSGYRIRQRAFTTEEMQLSLYDTPNQESIKKESHGFPNQSHELQRIGAQQIMDEIVPKDMDETSTTAMQEIVRLAATQHWFNAIVLNPDALPVDLNFKYSIGTYADGTPFEFSDIRLTNSKGPVYLEAYRNEEGKLEKVVGLFKFSVEATKPLQDENGNEVLADLSFCREVVEMRVEFEPIEPQQEGELHFKVANMDWKIAWDETIRPSVPLIPVDSL